MYELKKIGKVFASKFVGTGPSSYKKRIYRAAVSQRLRNTVLHKIKRWQANWIGHILRRSCFFKTRYWRKDRGKKWREDEEEDVHSCRMTLRKQKYAGIWKKKHHVTLYWELAL